MIGRRNKVPHYALASLSASLYSLLAEGDSEQKMYMSMSDIGPAVHNFEALPDCWLSKYCKILIKESEFNPMKTNIFLRSTRRQPMRAVCLVLVMLFVTFAFVGRVSEYLLIKQETERLEGYYRAIGTLEGTPWTDTRQAAAYLEQNPLVQAVNTFNYTSGVIEDDICNADTETWFQDIYKMYFYGTLLQKDSYEYVFRIDTVLAGMPEYIQVGDLVRIFPQTSGWGGEEAANLPKIGERYLAASHYHSYNASIEELPGGARGVRVEAMPLTEGCYFYSVPAEGEADWSAPALQGVERQIRYVRDQQHSLNIIPLQDMSALPMVQEDEPDIYLTKGRWLNGGDDAAGSRVCVVNANFASLRNLSLGDTLTIRLRDIPSYIGYSNDADEGVETRTDSYEIVGLYDYMTTYPKTTARNYTYIPASAVPDSFQRTTSKTVDTNLFEYITSTFTDKGAAPAPPMPGTVSFLLKDAETQAQFEAETKDALEAMGFHAAFLPNGLEAFQTASQTMRQSSLYNALIYTLILTAALGLAVFVYFFLRRHELAIVRALGVPVGRCVREISLPMFLLGLAATVTGSLLGWRYTWENAAATLDALSAFGDGTIQPLPVTFLFLLGGGALVLMALLTVGTAWALARIPVLRQVQGGAPAGAKKKAASPDAAQVAAPQSSPAIVTWTGAALLRRPAVRKGRRTLGIRYTMRFVWRHIARAKGKTALAFVLAAVFTAGLAAIRLAIATDREEIERLYQNTTVTIELMKADSTQKTPGGAFLFEDTVQTVLDTGYITDAYLEGANDCSVFRYDGGWTPGQVLSIRPQGQTDSTIRSIDSVEDFLATGSGTAVQITYMDGWDTSLFGEDWSAKGRDALYPIVLPKETFDAQSVQPGDALGVSCKEAFRMCAVAGYYEGQAAGESGGAFGYNENAPILMPTSALQAMMRNMLYGKAVFTVDPSQNRDLEPLRAAIDALANTPHIGGVPVRTVVWDQELRMAVEPLEKAVELMELLYPVALVLSLLSGAGAAALLVVLSAKEAAILRVQGTSRIRTILMLGLQQIFPCFAGLLIGLTGILLYINGATPDLRPSVVSRAALCAVAYLLAGTSGAIVSAVTVIRKNPLEMLQVKE